MDTSQSTFPNSTLRHRIEYLTLDALHLNPKNARLHDKHQVKQIARSIETFGFNVPILIDGERMIIAGHGRWLAAKRLRLSTVPTIAIEHLTPAQQRAFVLADNRLAEGGKWDMEVLIDELEYLDGSDLDFPVTDTGFEAARVDWFIKTRHLRNEPKDELEQPVDGPSITKEGDLWHLGDNRLLCGDALSAPTYAKLMGPQKASLVFADPPYNVRIDGHAGGKGRVRHREFAMAAGEMNTAEFTQFLRQVFQRLAAVTSDGSMHFICMDWRHLPEILQASHDVYDEFKNLCVWGKDNAGMGSLYRSQHELVLVFKKGAGPHVNNIELGKHGRNRSNLWILPASHSFGRSLSEGNLSDIHPTVKPVTLVEEIFYDCSERGSWVLDPFLGSGTSLIAAEKAARKCFGVEIDPHYCDASIRRWQKFTGHKAVLVASGKTFNALETAILEGSDA